MSSFPDKYLGRTYLRRFANLALKPSDEREVTCFYATLMAGG
jgi:hypothetical protein